MKNISIDILIINDESFYSLDGYVDEILANKRLLMTLKRLGYSLDVGKILIPFNEKSQLLILQELQHLLKKFDYGFIVSDEIADLLSSFQRDEETFSEFSRKAKLIRNNEFKENPDLVEKFDEFRKVLSLKLVRDLYPLQLLSAFHMAFSQNSCNFAVPGAGKTSIVYAAYAYLKNLPESDPKHVNKLIVIGPLSSFGPWEKEYKKCFGRPGFFQRLSGDLNVTKELRLEHLYAASPSEVTLIFHGGVEPLQKDIIDFLKRNKTMIVVDEAHRIKNPDGLWGKSIAEVSKEAISRIILTGTPVPNGYQDIFNLFKFIHPFRYKEVIKFHYQNLVDMSNNEDINSARVNQLKENLAPFFIRIKKDDLGLPPVHEHEIKIDMNSYQREIYDFIESSYRPQFADSPSATYKDIINRAKLIRLRQASTNPSLLAKPLTDAMEHNEATGEVDSNSRFIKHNELFVDDSDFFYKVRSYESLEIPQKFHKALEIIKSEIIPKNAKVIIWTIFIQNAKALQSFLFENKINSKLLIGEIIQAEREVTIDQFDNPENLDFQVLIANPFSVAESISLHNGCHNAIYLERDYNCSNFIQSKDRIHRVGLTDQETNYYYLVSTDSIDEVIDTKLKMKIERMNNIINDEIPLFSRINDTDETDIIKELMANYARRT